MRPTVCEIYIIINRYNCNNNHNDYDNIAYIHFTAHIPKYVFRWKQKRHFLCEFFPAEPSVARDEIYFLTYHAPLAIRYRYYV